MGIRGSVAASATAFIVAMSVFPVSAAAEESSAEKTAERRQVEEVIVTAERQEASVQDTSISITAFTGEFLDSFGIRNQEDLAAYTPATTIQAYDATIRGVGRNFRALGGDPGVSTYMNGIYSEDLLTATAASFWDVERIEILRGPQGTLYGRNAVGGAMNIIYKEPTPEFESSLRTVLGNFGQNEYYGMVSGPVSDTLEARANFSVRNRDGFIDDIGPGAEEDDSLGARNIALVFKYQPIDTVTVDLRTNWMKNNRVFGAGNGGGLTVLTEDQRPVRNTTDLAPGFRFIDTTQTTNPNLRNFYDATKPIYTFRNPNTGVIDQAQAIRAGVDAQVGPSLNGFQNAAASLTSFNNTSPAAAAAYNNCVFGSGTIDGQDVCAATSGYNREKFDQNGIQMTTSWDALDHLQLKYLFGYNQLSYQRYTDDDGTGSLVHDRQFYVNHEAKYMSHEFQAFYDFADDLSFTSGVFFYDAQIDQRGDFFSSLKEARMTDPYQDNTALSAGAAAAGGLPASLVGINASTLAFAGRPMVTLYSARNTCTVPNPPPSCNRNAGPFTPGSIVNLQTSAWYGDNGTNPLLNVKHGPNTAASDLLYQTSTTRKAFAAYTQGVYDISPKFTLTLGARYAVDDLAGEENLWRYSETGAFANTTSTTPGFLALYGGNQVVNIVNGGLTQDSAGNFLVPTPKATNQGIPFALSVYRGLHRQDEKWTGRANVDWNISDDDMMYASVTTGYRSGGFSLVYFSTTPTYDPEELIAYEIGYKTQFLDKTLQVNGSFYYYDYSHIQTFATEVSPIGGTATAIRDAPGAEVKGVEVEVIWLPTDNLSIGGNASYTPSEYTKSLLLADPANYQVPPSLYPNFLALTKDIKHNQLLQVPEGKATIWSSYKFNMPRGADLEFFATYSWTDQVYFSPFQDPLNKADAYDRTDVRATYTTAKREWVVTGFCNNVFDKLGIDQIIEAGESYQFRQTALTTSPRMYGLEVTYQLGNH